MFTFILMPDIVSWSRCHGIITLSVIDRVPNIFFSYRNNCGSSNVIYFHVFGLQVQKKEMYF